MDATRKWGNSIIGHLNKSYSMKGVGIIKAKAVIGKAVKRVSQESELYDI